MVEEGFQNTDTGIIPIDWKEKKLSKVATFENGKAHEQFIDDKGAYVVVNSKFISTEGAVRKYSNKNLCPLKKGDIAIVMSDIPNGRALAKCFLVDKDNYYTLNQRIGCIRAGDELNTEFLYYFLNRNKYFLSFDNGAGQTNLKKSEIEDCPVAYPSCIKEQENIAAALVETDGLIAELQKSLLKKRNLRQGVLQKYVSGNERLPGFTSPWVIKSIGEFLKIKHGKSQKEVQLIDGEYPILATSGIIGWAKEYIYDKPSVLIGRKGTIDVPRYSSEPFWAIDTIFYSHVNEGYDPKFIFYRFHLVNWLTYNEGSGVPSLNAKTIEGIELLMPTCEDEQKKIAEILTDLDDEISEIEKQLKKYTMLRQGVEQNLLHGKLRIKS